MKFNVELETIKIKYSKLHSTTINEYHYQYQITALYFIFHAAGKKTWKKCPLVSVAHKALTRMVILLRLTLLLVLATVKINQE